MSTTKTDYPYIVLWGKMMGSGQYYIDAQVEQARADDAPANATFKRSEYGERPGQWSTIDDCTNPDAFVRMGLEVPDRIRYASKVKIFKHFNNPDARMRFENMIKNRLLGTGVEVYFQHEDYPDGKTLRNTTQL
jgi:hypothetical protein